MQCPVPLDKYPHIQLAHGGGGKLMQDLVSNMFRAAFDNAHLGGQTDSAVLDIPAGRTAFTTDSYVVSPLFFPGGDIGSLAVYGTVNDLATSGANPLYLSAGFIIEEGFSMETLWKITQSMAEAAKETGVMVVTGDTKVVERGKCDGVYINTSGIGTIEHDLDISPRSIKEGDAVLITGDIGRHGSAVMSAREHLGFEGGIKSDSAPLADMVAGLIEAEIDIHCLRDLTRGGLAAALNEIASAAGCSIDIVESAVPVSREVSAFCEITGIDAYHIANEGRMAIFLPHEFAEDCLGLLIERDKINLPSLIGRVIFDGKSRVRIENPYGVIRILDIPSGELLPRIC
ncbi:MAG: hydrogenase expression/formation protein HypE [candidate division Zixibacteria bacterium]|nr:hydrogenase expression/formation protein HypE [candidate division Zixibacteria bacterium]